MNYLTLYQVALSAISKLHLPTGTDEVPFLMKIANDGARRIKCWETIIREKKEFEVDNEGRICLPQGVQRVLAIKIFQNEPDCDDANNTNPIRQPGGSLYYMDCLGLNQCGIGTNNLMSTSGTYDLNGNTLQIYGYRNCKACVVYMGYNLDENGHMKVLPEWEDALVYFLCTEYAVAFKWPQNIINYYDKNWVACVRGIKGDSQLRQMQNQKGKIASIMSSYLPQRNIYSNQ